MLLPMKERIHSINNDAGTICKVCLSKTPQWNSTKTRPKNIARLLKKGVGDCKDGLCQKNDINCREHEKQNFQQNPRYRLATLNAKQYREVLPKDVSIFCQCQKLQSYAKKWDFLKNLIYSSDIVELKFFYILGSVDFLRALRTRN